MPISIIEKDSRKPVGKVGNFSVSRQAVPLNPADTSMAIPTFSANLTEVGDNPERIMDKKVELSLGTAEDGMTSSVVSYSANESSGMVSIDTNSIFERLNTEQTCLPIFSNSASNYSIGNVISAWAQECGIFTYQVPGEVQSYIRDADLGFQRNGVGRWRRDVANGDLWTLAGVTYAWTGTPHASTSVLRRWGTVQRTNLVTNPEFGLTTNGWTNAGSVTTTRVLRSNNDGSSSYTLRLNYPTAASGAKVTGTVSLVGGQTYTLSAQVAYGYIGNNKTRMQLGTGPTKMLDTNGGIFSVDFTPTTTGSYPITFEGVNVVAGEIAGIEGVSVELKSTVKEPFFFDGNTAFTNGFATDFRLSYGTNDYMAISPAQPVLFGARLNNSQLLDGVGSFVEWQYGAQGARPYTTISLGFSGNTLELRETVGIGGTSTLIASVAAPFAAGACYDITVKASVTVAAPKTVTYQLQAFRVDNGLNTLTQATGTRANSVLATESGFSKVRVVGLTGPSLYLYMSYGSDLPKIPNKPTFEAYYDASIGEGVPAVQGFTGNVWQAMRELCSIYGVDLRLVGDQLTIQKMYALDSQDTSVRFPQKSNVRKQITNRTKARSVEVVHYKLKPTFSNVPAVMWKSDSVFSLERGEKKVETIQTDATFVGLFQPIPVGGVPVPYTWGYGSYVVTGNDEYIIDPQWWKDNGGSITVAPTKKSGEIEITMQAPNVDSVRAPYRISEGVADRPALYITGIGVVAEKETVKIFTGEADSAEDVGVTFDSPFVTDLSTVYTVGNKLSCYYGGADSELSFSETMKLQSQTGSYEHASIPKLTDYPEGRYVYHKGAIFRTQEVTQNPASIEVGKAGASTYVDHVNKDFGIETVADFNNYHSDKLVRDFNNAPLKQYLS